MKAYGLAAVSIWSPYSLVNSLCRSSRYWYANFFGYPLSAFQPPCRVDHELDTWSISHPLWTPIPFSCVAEWAQVSLLQFCGQEYISLQLLWGLQDVQPAFCESILAGRGNTYTHANISAISITIATTATELWAFTNKQLILNRHEGQCRRPHASCKWWKRRSCHLWGWDSRRPPLWCNESWRGLCLQTFCWLELPWPTFASIKSVTAKTQFQAPMKKDKSLYIPSQLGILRQGKFT